MPSGRLQSAVVRNAEGAPHVLKTGDAPRKAELTTRLRGVVQPTAARVEPKEAGCVERRSSGFVEAPRSNRSVLAVGEHGQQSRGSIRWPLTRRVGMRGDREEPLDGEARGAASSGATPTDEGSWCSKWVTA